MNAVCARIGCGTIINEDNALVVQGWGLVCGEACETVLLDVSAEYDEFA